MSIVDQLVDTHRDLHGSQLEAKTITKLIGQLWDHMTWNVVLALVVLLHQAKDIRKHVGPGRQIELLAWVSLNEP